MKRFHSSIACAVAASAFLQTSALAQPPAATPPAAVTLTRLDCGTSPTPSDVGRFNDAFAFNGLKVQLAISCYLIRHGDDYMIWDAGNPVGTAANAPKTSLVDLLAQLKVTPAQVRYVGISHYHGDHTGQVSSFPQATLLIGKGDWDVLSDPKAGPGIQTAPFASWISGSSKVEPQPADKDVFGDGSVILLNMPGHTPGHHSLLVRLKDMGPVLISGDLTHFQENYDLSGVPTLNTDRAASLASIDRFRKIATNLKATVIIQHDARHVSRLPAFPAAAH